MGHLYGIIMLRFIGEGGRRVEAVYYMEYKESKKTIEETFDAYYRYKNLKRWGPFKIQDIEAKVEKKADKRFKEIRSVNRKERTVRVEFYEESFCCMTGDVKQEYTYTEVEGIYETDTSLAFVVGKNRKKDVFLALKKGSVKGKGLSGLKEFLLNRCEKVKDGVVFI